MGSWVRSITSPFRKSCIFRHHHNQNHHHHHQGEEQNHHHQQQQQQRENSKSPQSGLENKVMDLHSEVMACAYEDVQVMWSMLDKSKPRRFDVSS